MNKFQQDLAFGKQGERVVEKYLNTHPKTNLIMNASDDKWFQNLDIDYLWQDNNNQIYKIEVKTDSMAHKTGNIAYEVISNKYCQSQGCFEKTQSDFIFYYLIMTQEIYCINTRALQQFVHEHSDDLRYVSMGDNAQGYLVPIKLLLEHNIGKKLNYIK